MNGGEIKFIMGYVFVGNVVDLVWLDCVLSTRVYF